VIQSQVIKYCKKGHLQVKKASLAKMDARESNISDGYRQPAPTHATVSDQTKFGKRRCGTKAT